LKFFELFLALRYLKGSRRTMGGSLTSVIAVAGVTVGVAALIATLAVMTGFREDIRAKILGAQPHLLIQPVHRTRGCRNRIIPTDLKGFRRWWRGRPL
jgi:ABC-type lipoprotein release transport system permease subunit